MGCAFPIGAASRPCGAGADCRARRRARRQRRRAGEVRPPDGVVAGELAGGGAACRSGGPRGGGPAAQGRGAVDPLLGRPPAVGAAGSSPARCSTWQARQRPPGGQPGCAHPQRAPGRARGDRATRPRRRQQRGPRHDRRAPRHRGRPAPGAARPPRGHPPHRVAAAGRPASGRRRSRRPARRAPTRQRSAARGRVGWRAPRRARRRATGARAADPQPRPAGAGRRHPRRGPDQRVAPPPWRPGPHRVRQPRRDAVRGVGRGQSRAVARAGADRRSGGGRRQLRPQPAPPQPPARLGGIAGARGRDAHCRRRGARRADPARTDPPLGPCHRRRPDRGPARPALAGAAGVARPGRLGDAIAHWLGDRPSSRSSPRSGSVLSLGPDSPTLPTR